MSYGVVERGQKYTESYVAFLKDAEGKVVSPFHDIPLVASGEGNERLLNVVVEVPRWTNAKLEINKNSPLNPIKQDIKKGVPRFVVNVFPHHGYIWNYGAFPQTWEDPAHVDENTQAAGDNDPLDVCDISSIKAATGSVIQVKVLGVLAMIDEGETDWKIIAINAADPLAAELNDIADVDKVKPGLLHATLEWFKYYKVPDGKPTNKFAFKNQFKNREFAWSVVDQTHESWKSLISRSQEEAGELQLANTTLDNDKTLPQEAAYQIIDASPEYQEAASLPENVSDWFHIIRAKPVPAEPAAEPAVNGEVGESGDAPVQNGESQENGDDAPAGEEGAAPESQAPEGDEAAAPAAGGDLNEDNEQGNVPVPERKSSVSSQEGEKNTENQPSDANPQDSAAQQDDAPPQDGSAYNDGAAFQDGASPQDGAASQDGEQQNQNQD
jgi:inorganic pyrophosphatase